MYAYPLSTGLEQLRHLGFEIERISMENLNIEIIFEEFHLFCDLNILNEKDYQDTIYLIQNKYPLPPNFLYTIADKFTHVNSINDLEVLSNLNTLLFDLNNYLGEFLDPLDKQMNLLTLCISLRIQIQQQIRELIYKNTSSES